MTTQSDRGLELKACRGCGDKPEHISNEHGPEIATCPLCDIRMEAITFGVLCAKWNHIMGYQTKGAPVGALRPVTAEVSEAMIEAALYAYWQKDRHAQAFNFHDRGSMRAALTAALKAQKGVGG